MSKVYAYVRVSTDRQELENQRHEIERYCKANGLVVAEDGWDEDIASGTVKARDRQLGELLARLRDGDTLVVSEISRISRTTLNVLQVLEDSLERGITIRSVKEGLVFDGGMSSTIVATVMGLAAQIERSLISARTKEALARKKAEGVRLGRPPGTHRAEHLKLHGKDEKILQLMDKRVSKAAMARLFDVNVKTLREYINRQNLEQEHRWRQFKKLDD